MIKTNIQKVLALIKKEFITIWKDPKSRGIILALPMMQLIIFANAVTMEVKNIDIAVIDRNNSVESRELISGFENSPRCRNIYHVGSTKQMKEKIDIQRVQLGLYIDNDFSDAIKKGKPVSVEIWRTA